MRRHRTLITVLVMLVASIAPATSLAVCDLVSNGIVFGDYGPLDTAHRDSLGHVRVTCDGTAGSTVSYVLKLSTGTTGTFRPRSMSGGARSLAYNLYKNAARSEVWGDGNEGTEIVVDQFTLPASGGPALRDHPVYARLFARQNVAPGAYTDLIQVTLESCDSSEQCQVVTAALSIQ